MIGSIDLSDWLAGGIAFGFVAIYATYMLVDTVAHHRARAALDYRIMVTGTRGKSGTVRLVHAALATHFDVYSKISGAAAREIRVDGTEVATIRPGSTSVSELPQVVRRAAREKAQVGVFECMAVTPHLIELVQHVHLRAQMVIIPTIRLDHLEEEGLSELEIGKSMLQSVGYCDVLVTSIEQPEILEYYREDCANRGIELIEVEPDPSRIDVEGHHPANVALALRVADYLGVNRAEAEANLQSASFEPHALESYFVDRGEGRSISLVDLGSANDPESAWEAFAELELGARLVVPVMVNRWERPLRSISFFSSIRQHFSVVGVTGGLSRWMEKRHDHHTYRDSVVHNRVDFFPITARLARDPEQLATQIEVRLGRRVDSIVVVLIENVHEARVDRLRDTFHAKGEMLTFETLKSIT